MKHFFVVKEYESNNYFIGAYVKGRPVAVNGFGNFIDARRIEDYQTAELIIGEYKSMFPTMILQIEKLY